MSRNINLYLNDIVNTIEKIQKYTLNFDFEQLLEDEKTLDAVIHNLMIIGEATKHIPQEILINYTQIEWQKIAGLRDIIAHGYFSLNTQIIWDIINTKLEDLKNCVEIMIQDENIP